MTGSDAVSSKGTGMSGNNITTMQAQTRGWVNFPFDDPGLEWRRNSGLFVNLVAVDERKNTERTVIDFVGANIHIWLSGNFAGDNTQAWLKRWHWSFRLSVWLWRVLKPLGLQRAFLWLEHQIWERFMLKAQNRQEKRYWNYQRRFFPYDGELKDQYTEWLSRPFRAAVEIGASRFAVWDKDYNPWRCTYDDLTNEGKDLYHSLQTLYPECRLYLLTWVDA